MRYYYTNILPDILFIFEYWKNITEIEESKGKRQTYLFVF